MVKIALSLDIPEFDLEELFSFSKQVGFDGVNYDMKLLDLLKKPTHVLQLSEQYDLPIITTHQPVALQVLTPQLCISPMVRAATYFPDATISNHHISGMLHPLWQNTQGLIDFVQKADKKKKKISFESNPRTFPLTYYPKTSFDPALFGDYCMHHNLSITVDTSHIADNAYDIVEFFKRFHSHIGLFHLSDYDNGVEHLPLGMGKLPIEALLREIKVKKWKGIIVFEIIRFPGMNTKEEKLRALTKSLHMVRKILG